MKIQKIEMTVNIYETEGIKNRFKIIQSNVTYECFKAFFVFKSYIVIYFKLVYRLPKHAAKITI